MDESTNSNSIEDLISDESIEPVEQRPDEPAEVPVEVPEGEEQSEASPEIDVDQYYWKLRNYVEMVANGEHDALLIDAPPGIGKSYQITDTLENSVGSSGFIKLSGYITPVELFHALFEASNGKVLFLDDVEGVLSSKKAMAILKQATWTEGNKRYVEWRSTSSKIEVPEKFRFMGRVIMVFNETPDGDIWESLKSRCLPYEMNFTHKERLEITGEIAKKPYKDLSLEERQEIVEWIKDHTTPSDEVDLRLLFNIMDIRAHNEDDWELLAIEQLATDEETMLVRDLVDDHETIKGAIEAYQDETGNDRDRFFQIYEKLDEDREL